MRPVARLASFVFCLGLAVPAFAGFQSTETFLPAVGRLPGQGGAQFYTTVWATNLTGVPVTFTFDFLKNGQANPSPANFQDTLAPGQTKMYENVVESKFGLTNALGAARVTSSGEILLAERIYDQAPGDDLGKTVGLFFAGVPKTFSIVSGQSASIQGVNQGGSENFRYNFALIETGGGSPTVNVQIFDGNGALLGQKAYPLSPYEQLQPGVGDVVAGFSSINARITATVMGGTGSVLLAGAQLANESQDSSGFEMSFRDDILGSGGGTAGVTSLNGLTGAVTFAAGSNVTLNKAGQTITIATSGGTGNLSLPFSGSTSSSNPAFAVTNTGSGYAIEADASGGIGVHGVSTSAAGVYGRSTHSIGVVGQSDEGDGVHGFATGLNGDGVYGTGPTGVYGQGTGSFDYGVFGQGYTGVWGQGSWGVIGVGSSYGIYAQGDFGGTGAKYFVEPHPTDPEKEIRFVCLEGPESGTYFRGSSRTVNGIATIEVPESFRMVTDEKNLTVVALPRGELAMIACVRMSLDRIVIQSSKDVDFDYVVNGVRKAFKDHEAISENKDFVPRSATDPLFTMGLPAESIRRLKASGILNPDGSINLETAHRLEWDKRAEWRQKEPETERMAATPR